MPSWALGPGTSADGAPKDVVPLVHVFDCQQTNSLWEGAVQVATFDVPRQGRVAFFHLASATAPLFRNNFPQSTLFASSCDSLWQLRCTTSLDS